MAETLRPTSLKGMQSDKGNHECHDSGHDAYWGPPLPASLKSEVERI
jgi:hypothetical protein